MDPRSTGRRGEHIAAWHLERRGWTVLARNYKSGRKEIDLIARRGKVLAFIEVKTRRGIDYGHPLSAIAGRKRNAIREVAENWIERFGERDLEYRFDAVAVFATGFGHFRVQHVENAWGY